MAVLANVAFVLLMVLLIGLFIYRDYKNAKLYPSRKQERKSLTSVLPITIHGGSKKLRMIAKVMCVCFIVSSIFGVRQYIIKQRYESYLSSEMSSDYVRLTSAVRENQAMYDQIVQSQSLSREQAENLIHENHYIVKITQEHRHLVSQFKRSKQDLSNQTANDARDFAYYIEGLIWDVAEREGIDVQNKSPLIPSEMPESKQYQLKDDELKVIENIKGVNQVWIQSIARNVKGVSKDGDMNYDVFSDEYRDQGITSTYWVDVAIDMEEEADRYKSENHFIPTNLN